MEFHEKYHLLLGNPSILYINEQFEILAYGG